MYFWKVYGLKMVPRLNEVHIYPSMWQKMTVSPALFQTQFYSKHMAIAIKFYREDQKTARKFKGLPA